MLSLLVAILKGTDGGAVYSLRPMQIHTAHYVQRIGLAQEWVRAQMQADHSALRDMAIAVMQEQHPNHDQMTAQRVEQWIAQAERTLLAEQPELLRYEQAPPALLTVFDIRSCIRVGRRRSGEDVAAVESGAGGQQSQGGGGRVKKQCKKRSRSAR